MNALLQSKQSALARARGAQQVALVASRAKGTHLQSEIARARPRRPRPRARPPPSPGAVELELRPGAGDRRPTLGPNGGWAIPYAIVLCESGGTNLPPNSAGASGYYQIVPATWKLFGGTGPAAYLAPKAEQDAVASRIWDAVGPELGLRRDRRDSLSRAPVAASASGAVTARPAELVEMLERLA